MFATVASHHGNGWASIDGGARAREDAFPEYLVFPNPGEAASRGVLKGIAAGTYGIEFIGYQRAGAAHFEIYAAEGAWDDDAATDLWRLAGGPEGLEIVSDVTLSMSGVRRDGSTVTLDCVNPNPGAAHELVESTDLVTWRTVSGAVITAAIGSAGSSPRLWTGDLSMDD